MAKKNFKKLAQIANSIRKVVVGTLFYGSLAVGVLGVSTFGGAKLSGGAPMLEGFAMMAIAFGFLIAVPFGIAFKMVCEEDI